MEKLSGFFSSDGARLLSQQELQKADNKLSTKKSETKTPELEADTVEATVANALGEVKSRSFSQVNEIGNQLHGSKSDLRAAKKQVRKEAKVLGKLEKAIENGNTEKADELRQEFKSLQSNRAELTEQIDRNNSERGVRKPVRLGNKVITNITVERVQFKDKTDDIDLSDVESIRNARKNILTEERQALRQQSRSVNSELKDLRKANREIKNTVQDLIKTDESKQSEASEALGSFGEAEKLANATAKNIARTGEQSFNFNNLQASSVQALLQA